MTKSKYSALGVNLNRYVPDWVAVVLVGGYIAVYTPYVRPAENTARELSRELSSELLPAIVLKAWRDQEGEVLNGDISLGTFLATIKIFKEVRDFGTAFVAR